MKTNKPVVSRLHGIRKRAAFAFMLTLLATHTFAALKTWDGSFSANWNVAANWSPSGVPQDGDDLSFPAGALNPANNNDITDLRVASIQFSGAGGGYSLSGNAITVSNGVVGAHSAGLNSIHFTITNAAIQTYTLEGGGTIDINGNIVLLGGFNLTINNDFLISLFGTISGTGNLIKSSAGTGALRLGSLVNNTYSGTTSVNGGILQLDDTAGATAVMVPGDLTIGALGTVTLFEDNQIADTSDVTVSGALNLNNNNDAISTLTMTAGTVTTGTGFLTNGNITTLVSGTPSTIDGNLHLGNSTRTFNVADGAANPDLDINAVVLGGSSGSFPSVSYAGITKTGAGQLRLDGVNTYAGPTTVNAGTLAVGNNSGLGTSFALFGDASTYVNSSGALLLINAHITNEFLTLNSVNASGALQVDSTGDWIGGIALNTNVVIEASSLLQLGGAISGPGGFTKIGASTLRLIGTNINTYGGATTVDAGTLELAINANNGAIPGPLNIGDGSGTDTVRLLDSDQMANNTLVTLDEGGVLDINGFSDIFGAANMTGATIQSGAGTARMSGDLTVNASSISSTISGNLALIGSVRTFTVADGTAAPDLLVSAVISGSSAIVINNAPSSSVHFSGANTYSGLTTINDGIFDVLHASALGGSAVGTIINGPNFLVSGGVTVVNEALTNISSSTLQGTVASAWTGPIVLNAHLNLQLINVIYTMELSGVISGTGSITTIGGLTGGGTFTFSGVSPNTYSGMTTVDAGTLVLAKASAILNSASLVIGDGTDSDVVRYTAANAIDAGVPITINESGLLDLNGFNDTLGALTLVGGDITTGVGTLTMSANLSAVSTAAGSSANISGTLNLGVSTRTFTVTNGPSTPDLRVLAVVSGTGGIIKAGDGMMSLEGVNTFSGAVTLNAGVLRGTQNDSFGTTAGGVAVNNDAVLQLSSAHVGNEALTLNSSSANELQGIGGSNSWAGAVTISGNATIAPNAVSDVINFLGVVGGSGSLTKITLGSLYFSGASANTYAGTTTVNSGSLVLQKTAGVTAVPGILVIGDGSGGANADVVEALTSNQIADSAPVTVSASGLWNMATVDETIGALSGAGNIDLGTNGFASGDLTFGDANNTVFSGVMFGSQGQFTKQGTGAVTLTGVNTLGPVGGSSLVNEGTLIVNGSIVSCPLTVGAAGILAGSGTVAHITSTLGGVVAPGSSPGILTSSNVVINTAASDFTVELNGTAVGTGYDQLNSLGTVDITGATLNVLPGFSLASAPSEGHQFIILANNGVDPIVGTFTGRADNTTFAAGGLNFRIDYDGGISANDVVLTVTNLPAVSGATFVSSGNGNGSIEPLECAYLHVVVTNKTGSPITGISASLKSATPGVVVLQGLSAYPDIPASPQRRTNSTPFQLSVNTNLVCGENIALELSLQTATHNAFTIPVTLPTGIPGAVIASNNVTVSAIPDGGTLNSSITVAGVAGVVGKVTVSLHLTHLLDSDIDLTLEGPDGTIVELSTDNGAGANYGASCASRTTFDDAAASPITAGSSPFTGTFRPEGQLVNFRGKSGPDLNGTWTLHVTDDNFNAISGSLQCWTLNIQPATCVDGGGICELCPDLTIAGAVGPTGPALIGGRLTRDGLASTCGGLKTCPGPFVDGGFYEAHTFQNGPSNACISVTLSSATVDVFAATYTNLFNPADTCINYFADSGNSTFNTGPSIPVTYSFNVAANAEFIVVVNSIFGSTGPYTLQVSGGDCRPALNVTALPNNRARLDWTTAAFGYGLESTNALSDSMSPLWTPIPTVPVVINSRFTVTNNVTSTNVFYHLRKPLP